MSALRPASLLLVAMLLAAPAGRGQSAPPAAGAGLATVTVTPEQVVRESAFDGAVEAVNQASVAAQTSGRVLELPFDVGDEVPRGSVIVRLTDSEQTARVHAAVAGVAEARARLAEAKLAHERAEDLYRKGTLAKAQLDAASAGLDSAQARLEAAQAALAEAREALGYTVVRAPYAGTVVAREVQVGETVTPGRPLMTGLSLERLRAVVEIPQSHIGPLRAHRKARVVLPDGRSLEAAALRLPPNADPTTHTFRVLVTLPEGDHGIFPGMLVKVAFVSGTAEELLVPGSAVVRRGEITGVYVVDEAGRVSLRYVRTGSPTADGRVPVRAGLAAGERVATDPIAAAIAYKKQGLPGAGARPPA